MIGVTAMRYHGIDTIRGLNLISMLAYHFVWDEVYLFHKNWTWFYGTLGYLWQQSICWIFILLAGFCWSMGRNKWKRGLIVFGTGAMISIITLFVMPEYRIIIGVLTCIGSCTLIFIPLEQLLKKIPTAGGFFGSFLLFLLFRNINLGYLGFESWNFIRLPEDWYCNFFTTYIGLKEPNFYSSDYFSILPWIFLFSSGYFCYRILKEKQKLSLFMCKERKLLETLGRKSLIIYIIHQPLLSIILYAFHSIVPS